MTHNQPDASLHVMRYLLQLLILALGLLFHTQLFAFTLNVVDSAGNPVAGGFRWTLEEDVSYRQPLDSYFAPGAPGSEAVHSFNFYKSHMPVVGSGRSNAASANVAVPDAARHYYVSVLSNNGNYQLSGQPVAPGQAAVTVALHNLPAPTAQVRVIAFEDTNPLNNIYDRPQELGLGGFTVKIDDTLDVVKQDVFGNMLGTVYQRNADGSPVLDVAGNPVVQCPGNGVILTITQADIDAANAGNTCRNPYNLAVGEVLVKNLHPGKYGVQIVPPTGSAWQQTATIEGTKTIDAWVKSNEPVYFADIGAARWHGEFGFVQPFNVLNSVPAAGALGSISGRIVNMHMSRPPEPALWPGHPLENCWIGLNEWLLGGLPGRGLYAAPCEVGAVFNIPGVPPGTYQFVIFDKYLNNIFGTHTVVVPPGGAIALGDTPVFRWFGAHDHYVYYDTNGNGVRDPGEIGIPEQNINLRFRDGSMYQTFPTDMQGFVPFDEVFPFFFWQVAEVDFARFKATGVTVTVDAGGQVDNGPFGQGKLNPQLQADGTQRRIERTADTGVPVLLEGFQTFIGTTNIFEWGKQQYNPGENGGISGILHYTTTRAENDPRFAAVEDWEPGIPRVQVNLYRDNGTGAILDVNGSGAIELADVDNYPLGWADGGAKGPEDLDRNNNGVFDAGDAINVVHADSWDDSLPTGCPAGNAPNAATDPFYLNGKCFDGQRNFNQVRPAVFDGGYMFLDFYPGGMGSGSLPQTLPPGLYIVEAATPPGYAHQKEEDKNIDFGDSYVPSPLLLPPVCVGDAHTVPAELALFPGIPAPFAGQSRPLCDRKQVPLADRQNAAADFFMFTEAPITGHIRGLVTNDLANEYNLNSPGFGEKQLTPFFPISIRDWAGREVNRVYTDQNGAYNGLVPGTYTKNRPSPTGVSESMYQACINDPGPIPDPANPANLITDPYFNKQYTQFCYTFNFLPGKTTFLDTPVLPIAAFANLGINPVDAELPDGTPMIHSVTSPNGVGGGPYVPAGQPQQITVTSVGTASVPNPAFTLGGTQPRTIARDFGFGARTAPSAIWIGATPLSIVSWDNASITATIPAGTRTGQLTIRRGDNRRMTLTGVTVTVGTTQVVSVPPGGSIQAAIDAAPANALVLVPPGNYEEMVIMYKPVRLQGWGPGSTAISLRTLNMNTELASTRVAQWRQKLSALIAANLVTLLPGQADPLADPRGFQGSETAPIFVAAPLTGTSTFASARRARIDGFTLSGSNDSGGIAVNSYAHYLTISNNRIVNNLGLFGGGIRVGHPLRESAINNYVSIHHNQVCENSTLQTPGGGIALYGGSNNYLVSRNVVCANFSQGDGAGIAHYGLSNNGRILNNQVLFNQTFRQGAGLGGAGGGILISGLPAATGLTAGSGSLRIEANLIQGNQASTGDGAGIALVRVNGTDVERFRRRPNTWHSVNVFDNVIVNNVTGVAGGGIALQDALRVNILHNTIANNDSTATAVVAFQSGPTCTATANRSCPQPAGVIARANSSGLQAIVGPVRAGGFNGREWSAFSNPLFANNIVWHNRSFYYEQTPTGPGGLPVGHLVPDVGAGAAPVFNDLAVLGVAGNLDPRSGVLTSLAGYDPSNTAGDPALIAPYYNGDRAASVAQPGVTTAISVYGAVDEGGNWLDVRYGPLVRNGNYHLQRTGSAAAERGAGSYLTQFPALATDYDSRLRPICPNPDAGAVESPFCTAVAAAGTTTAANTPITINLAALGVQMHGANAGGAQSAMAVRTPTPAGGTVAISADRTSVTYTPATDWSGTDTFVAVVNDGNGLHSATASITVAPPVVSEGAPVAAEADLPAHAVPAETTGAGIVSGSAPDKGAATPVAGGATVALPANAGIGTAPVAAPTAREEVGVALAAPTEALTEPANEAPVAADDELVLRAFDTNRGVYSFAGSDILDNDADADGDTLTATLIENVKEGSVKLSSNGSFTYTPPKGVVPKGQLRFTYQANDGKHTSEPATVMFTLEPVGEVKKQAGLAPARQVVQP